MKVLKNNLAKNDIFVILGYGPFIFIRPGGQKGHRVEYIRLFKPEITEFKRMGVRH
jgi:uncharacterized protein YfaP (DUF2135 family)